jgi:hypothetical protein
MDWSKLGKTLSDQGRRLARKGKMLSERSKTKPKLRAKTKATRNAEDLAE